MPKSVSTIINDLATKAGIAPDNQALKDLLSNADLSKINIPDSLVDGIEGGLFNFDSAKANDKIRKALKPELVGETFNSFNSVFDSIATENEFDPDTIAALAAEKNSFERAKIVAKKIKELESAKAGATKGDKADLQKEINALKAEKANIVKDWEAKVNSLQSDYENKLTNMSIDNMLSRYNYALGEIDPEVKVLTARGVFEKALADAGAKIIKDPTTGKPILVAQNGSEFYDKSNNKKDLKSFLEGAIAPILSTAKAEPAAGKTTVIEGNSKKANSSAIEKLDASIAQLGG